MFAKIVSVIVQIESITEKEAKVIEGPSYPR